MRHNRIGYNIIQNKRDKQKKTRKVSSVYKTKDNQKGYNLIKSKLDIPIKGKPERFHPYTKQRKTRKVSYLYTTPKNRKGFILIENREKSERFQLRNNRKGYNLIYPFISEHVSCAV